MRDIERQHMEGITHFLTSKPVWLHKEVQSPSRFVTPMRESSSWKDHLVGFCQMTPLPLTSKHPESSSNCEIWENLI